MEGKVKEIKSAEKRLAGKLAMQIELKTVEGSKGLVERIEKVREGDFEGIRDEIKRVFRDKAHLLVKFEKLLKYKFVQIGNEPGFAGGIGYFNKALRILKELEQTHRTKFTSVLLQYESLLETKLLEQFNWAGLDSWLTLIQDLKNLFNFDITSLLHCAETCYTQLVHHLINEKNFEKGSNANSLELCDLLQKLDKKVKNGLHLKDLKTILIDVALDYVIELNTKEILKAKEDRKFLNRTLQILRKIQSVGFEVDTSCENIKEKFQKLLAEYEKIEKGGDVKEKLIGEKRFFGKMTVDESLEIDLGVRRTWKRAVVDGKKYFVKCYLIVDRSKLEMFQLEARFLRALSEQKSIFLQFLGNYEEMTPRFIELGIITEYSLTTLRTELQTHKTQNWPFAPQAVQKLALSLTTALSALYSSKLAPLTPSHLNISPESIILTPSHEWKLSNFNFWLTMPQYLTPTFLSRLDTKYMSPELKASCLSGTFRFIPVKSDVYSLALTLLEVITLKEVCCFTVAEQKTLFGTLERNPLNDLLIKALDERPENRPNFDEFLVVLGNMA